METRAKPNHAASFKISEVLELQELVHSAEDPWDAVFAGSALLAIYLTSRWAGLQCCEALELDYDAQGVFVFRGPGHFPSQVHAGEATPTSISSDVRALCRDGGSTMGLEVWLKKVRGC